MTGNIEVVDLEKLAEEVEENHQRPRFGFQRPENNYVASDPESEQKRTNSKMDDLLLASKIWFRTFLRSILVVALMYLSLGIYFLPAVITDGNISEVLINLLYVHIRSAFIQIFYYLTCILVTSQIFSFQIAVKGYLFTILPFFLVILLLLIADAMSLNFGFENGFIIIFMNMIIPFFVFYYLQKMKIKETISEVQKENYSLTKDGTTQALMKGWILLAFSMILLSYGLPAYMYADYASQILIRSLVLPFIIFSVAFSQHIALSGLSMEHMDRRLLVSLCSSTLLQYLGRMMVSNISEKPLSSAFLMMNLSLSVVEILGRVTYTQRYLVYKRLKNKIRGTSKAIVRSGKKISETLFSRKRAPVVESKEIVRDHNEISNFTKQMRAKAIVEEIGIEIRVIFTVPVLMHFLHFLWPNSLFLTVSSFSDCVIQIAIQMVFEFLVDLISLFMEIHYQSIPMQIPDIFSHDIFSLNYTISMLCLLYIAHFVSLFEAQ
eukprot:TRINITY_DN9906_c0_g1_i2.p1 TRINITY_DN9906_c0_g1~~TRINITY_DN9906_c0_g1_i2.p1  ORF type:complete len:492 (+),score=87.17 TRINITY_DN9906_c0_g1_i2:129-1604(+)